MEEQTRHVDESVDMDAQSQGSTVPTRRWISLGTDCWGIVITGVMANVGTMNTVTHPNRKVVPLSSTTGENLALVFLCFYLVDSTDRDTALHQ